MKIIRQYIVHFFLIMPGVVLAQEKAFKLNVTSVNETQYSITKNKRSKAISLLTLESSLRTDHYWKNGAFEFSVWAVGETSTKSIVADELTFSNIEERNYFKCSVLGYQHIIGNYKIFAGIRNINLDYFTAPYSSLFTNSSAGIFPTISLNYGVPNYPQSAFGIHMEYNTAAVSMKNSFYNNLIESEEKRFLPLSINPVKYGYTNTTQVMYTSISGVYAIGTVIGKMPKEKLNASVFGIIEQDIYKSGKTEIGIIGQIGFADKNKNYCYSYWGLGTIVNGLITSDKKDSLGLILYSASMQNQRETDMELTFRYSVASWLEIQPALHYIKNNDTRFLVGLLRATITYGN